MDSVICGSSISADFCNWKHMAISASNIDCVYGTGDRCTVTSTGVFVLAVSLS